MEELNLVPKKAETTAYEGEGGGYYLWAGANNPILVDAKLGAAKLLLHPHGLAIPHYADSAKIGYVLQGVCRVGMISPGSQKEDVIEIKKGDAIPVPLGIVSWWFNPGEEEDLEIVFLGETTRAYTPGQYTYFFVAGTLGILGAFSTNFLTKAFKISEEESEKLTKSQTAALITKLDKEIKFPKPTTSIFNLHEKLYTSIENKGWPAVDVKGGGVVLALTEANFPLLGKIGLSATLDKLEANATFGPIYGTDEAVRISYVIKGSGRVEIVGATGKAVLDSELEAGELFVVPRFAAAAIIAGGEGLHIFTVITTSKPKPGDLGGETSVWKALSSVVLQATLNVDAEFEASFSAKVEKRGIIVSPKEQK